MPVAAVSTAFQDGLDAVPGSRALLTAIPVVAVVYALKWYFQGATTGSERNMHGKVVMITGGTSGIGAVVAQELAQRGAQLVLLTQHPLNDLFLLDYIGELREKTGNELITAEQVDLTSLHSIRTFATKWIDNAPARRLDMIVLCATTITPSGGKISVTEDEVEENWQLNYLANFHLLSILSPAIRAQPPDRDVRIIFGTCASYISGELPVTVQPADEEKRASTKSNKNTVAPKAKATSEFNPAAAYAASKLALMTFALAFQKHLSAYERPDKSPNNARVLLVDPGYTRTPGMRRYLTWGSLFGLFLYLIMYPFWWLVLKSPEYGAQTFLYAAMEAYYGRGPGGWYLKECREMDMARTDAQNEQLQQALWEYSETMVQEAEKRGAKKRAEMKKTEDIKPKKEEPKPQPTKTAGSRRSKKA